MLLMCFFLGRNIENYVVGLKFELLAVGSEQIEHFGIILVAFWYHSGSILRLVWVTPFIRNHCETDAQVFAVLERKREQNAVQNAPQSAVASNGAQSQRLNYDFEMRAFRP